MTAIVLAVLPLFVIAHANLGHLVFPDSHEYTLLRGLNPTTAAFWEQLFAGRPQTIPIFFWLVQEPATLDLVQEVLYFLSFAGLAAAGQAYARTISGRILSFVLILVLMFHRDTLFWNHAELSETLSLSLLNFSLAVVLLAIRRRLTSVPGPAQSAPRPAGGALAALFLFCWIPFQFCRDTHVYLTMGGVLIAVALLPWMRDRRQVITSWSWIGCVLILAVWLQNHNARNAGRQTIPLVNTIGMRVLVEDSYRLWFQERGLILDASLVDELKGKVYWQLEPAWKERLLPYVKAQGTSDYVRFMLFHPEYVADIVAPALRDCLTTELVPGYAGSRGIPKVNDLLSGVATPFFMTFGAVVFALVVLSLFLFGASRPVHASIVVAFVAFGISQVAIAALGDAIEIQRHGLVGSHLIRLSFLFAVSWTVDSLCRIAETATATTSSDSPGFKLSQR